MGARIRYVKTDNIGKGNLASRLSRCIKQSISCRRDSSRDKSSENVPFSGCYGGQALLVVGSLMEGKLRTDNGALGKGKT